MVSCVFGSHCGAVAVLLRVGGTMDLLYLDYSTAHI